MASTAFSPRPGGSDGAARRHRPGRLRRARREGRRARGAARGPRPDGSAPQRGGTATPLAGTAWRLIEIQSMDDAVGSTRVADPSLLHHAPERGRLGRPPPQLQLAPRDLDGRGRRSDPSSGRFEFGPLAATMALCPPPSVDEQVTKQAPYFRSYLLKDGRLYLSLMADGGIFVWEPAEPGK